MKTFYISCIALSLALTSCSRSKDDNGGGGGGGTTPPPTTTKFVNPLLASGPDPWVLKQGSFYYYTHTSGSKVAIWKTQYMSDLGKATPVTVWQPPSDPNSEYGRDIWAPEIHYLDNKWYIYVSADKGGDNATHRVFVLENTGSDPTDPSAWTFKGKLHDTDDKWAIDATIFTYNGVNYAAWSGWPGNVNVEQDIYIAKLSNPYTIEGTRVMIAKPTYGWEGTINEGPEALINASGQLFLTYSGNGCWSDDYSLGLLTLKPGGNPLSPADWTKSPTPVFTKNTAGGAFGPGHNGFFLSPDGKENWILYHANTLAGVGCGDARCPRIQKFTWNADGTPNFGTPVAINAPIDKPSGE
ncbi:MAG: glycoside hydrolase family 43 protein [Bacteroidetes bacterium]|nr:glycoside hydrolase family 43 protein [Bacteroidota bacterium]